MDKEEAEVIENKKTRELIKEYGQDYVRGGDINKVDPMIKRFGWIFLKYDWETLIIFLSLIISNLIFIILYFSK